MGWLVFGFAVFILISWFEWGRAREKRQAAAMLQAAEQALSAEASIQPALFASPPREADIKGVHVLERRGGGTVTMDAPSYRLGYLDFNGDQTQREIVLLEMDASPESFQAYCFSRSAERTFRFDSVLNLVDISTGEIIPVAELWSALHLGAMPPPHLRHQSCSHVADALVCFARDELGGVKAKLRPIILDAMCKVAGEVSPGDEVMNTIINRRSRSGNVNRARAFLSITERDITLAAALDMVRASKRVPDPELLARADELFA